jgi:hypothetical protein
MIRMHLLHRLLRLQVEEKLDCLLVHHFDLEGDLLEVYFLIHLLLHRELHHHLNLLVDLQNMEIYHLYHLRQKLLL